MDQTQRTAIAEIIPEGVRFDCKMDQYTTFHVGGRADAVCFPDNPEQLRQLLSYLSREKLPRLIVGKGSNLLVRDGGIRSAVIILKGGLAAVGRNGSNEQAVYAWGGLAITELLSFCSLNGLAGLEFLAGIPGSVGGAVAMNAGAFGEEIGQMVKDVQLITGDGKTVLRDSSQLSFSYRESSIPKGTVILKVRLELKKGQPDAIRRKITDHLKKRKASQPLDFHNGGSIFRNPPGDFAGRLIDQAGLKGKKIGDAMISPEHANFIINMGSARAEDILALMELARKRVSEEMGIELEPEIRVVGE